jgi:hypothetical protein
MLMDCTIERKNSARQMKRVRDTLLVEARGQLIVKFDRQPIDRSIRFRVETWSGIPVIESSGDLLATEVAEWSDNRLWEKLIALSGGWL